MNTQQIEQQTQQRIAEAQAQSEAARRDLEWSRIFQTPIADRVISDTLANRQQILGWLHPGETFSASWFVQVIASDPSLLERLSAGPVMTKGKFSQFCKLEGFSETEGNFHAATSVLGRFFNESQLVQALRNGKLQLALATPEEQQALAEKHRQELRQREDNILRNGTDLEEQHRITERRFEQELRSTVRERQERDLVIGYERECVHGPKEHPLPQTYLGQPLDPTFIRRTSPELLKKLVQRWGSAQVTARLLEIKRATTTLDRGDGKGPVTVSYDFD